MERIQFIEHKGKQIIYFDLTDSKDPQESIKHGRQVRELILSQPPKSVLLLTNVVGAHYNPEASDFMKQFSSDISPHVKASAMVGVTGIRRIILSALTRVSGRPITVFDTVEQAKDWLADQG